MNATQYDELRNMEKLPRMISGKQIEDSTPRTLIYGYTIERNTFHVYIAPGRELVCVVYDHDGLLLKHVSGVFELAQCVPDKRVYPERCEFAFCKMLMEAGVNVPYTTFTEAIEPRTFYGKVVSELIFLDMEVFSTSYPLKLAELGVDTALGLQDYELVALQAEANSMVDGQLQGYLRERILRNQGQDDVSQWIKNIAPSIEYLFSRRFELIVPDFAAKTSQLIQSVLQFAENVVSQTNTTSIPLVNAKTQRT